VLFGRFVDRQVGHSTVEFERVHARCVGIGGLSYRATSVIFDIASRATALCFTYCCTRVLDLYARSKIAVSDGGGWEYHTG